MAWNQNFGEGANPNSGAAQQAWRDNFNGGKAAGNVMEIVRAITGGAMGGGGGTVTAQQLPTKQVVQQPTKAPAPTQRGKSAPTPQQRPTQNAAPTTKQAPVPRSRPQTTNEDRAFEQAQGRGLTVEQIAAGAAGAGAAVVAQQVINAMRGNKGGASTTIPTSKPPTKQGLPAGMVEGQPLPAGHPANQMMDVYFGRPQTQQPNQVVPQTKRPTQPTVQGSNNIVTRNGMTQGQPTNNADVAAQFYEIFGIAPPKGTNLEPRLTAATNGGHGEKGVTAGPNAVSRTTYTGAAPQSSIPGPAGYQKQLGDADSPTYRDNFGYSDIAMRAENIVNQMEQYGDYNIGKYIDVSAEPAVARAVGAALRGMM